MGAKYPGLKRILKTLRQKSKPKKKVKKVKKQRVSVMVSKNSFRVTRAADFNNIFDSFSSTLTSHVRSRSLQDSYEGYEVKKNTLYDTAWGIPSEFKMPAFWKPKNPFFYSLERGFCPAFKKESKNSNAELDEEKI